MYNKRKEDFSLILNSCNSLVFHFFEYNDFTLRQTGCTSITLLVALRIRTSVEMRIIMMMVVFVHVMATYYNTHSFFLLLFEYHKHIRSLMMLFPVASSSLVQLTETEVISIHSFLACLFFHRASAHIIHLLQFNL